MLVFNVCFYLYASFPYQIGILAGRDPQFDKKGVEAVRVAMKSHFNPLAERVDLPDILSTEPRSILWRARRRFNSEEALKEGAWKPSDDGGNLNNIDRMILANILYRSDSVFESGVGESSFICAYTGVPRYTGVDNSVEWLQKVSGSLPSHYRFHWADIGPISDYSVPIDPKSMPKWPLSSTAALFAEDHAFDLYFVDGRFRVATFAACMLHALLRGSNTSLFAIHDYTLRDYYHVVSSFGDWCTATH